LVKRLLIQNLLTYITYFTESLPLIFCLIFYSKIKTERLEAFFYYALLLSLLMFSGVASLYIFKSKAAYVSVLRIYSVVEYSCVSLLLYQIIKNTLIRKVILYSIVPFVLFALLNFIFHDDSKGRLPNYPPLIESLVLMTFIIYFFYEKMRTVILYPLSQSLHFWLCVGFFFYFTGTLFFFLFINYSDDREFKKQLVLVYTFVTITKNIILCLALLMKESNDREKEELHMPNDLNLDEFTLTKP